MNELPTPRTPASLAAWADRATRTRLDLHFQVTDPFHADRQRAFLQMSNLLREAIHMVHIALSLAREPVPGTPVWEGDGAGV